MKIYFFLRKLAYVLHQSWNFDWIIIKQTTGKYVKKYYFEWKSSNDSRKSATVIFTFCDDVIKKLLMLARRFMQFWKLFNPLVKPSVAFEIEINHLFFSGNQMTGFYMKCNSRLKWVKIVDICKNCYVLWVKTLIISYWN